MDGLGWIISKEDEIMWELNEVPRANVVLHWDFGFTMTN
jgi:hypothetical protein